MGYLALIFFALAIGMYVFYKKTDTETQEKVDDYNRFDQNSTENYHENDEMVSTEDMRSIPGEIDDSLSELTESSSVKWGNNDRSDLPPN